MLDGPYSSLNSFPLNLILKNVFQRLITNISISLLTQISILPKNKIKYNFDDFRLFTEAVTHLPFGSYSKPQQQAEYFKPLSVTEQ